MEHFVYFEVELDLELLVAVVHIVVGASLASSLCNDVHTDPFVAAGLDRVDASDVAFRVEAHVAQLDADDIFVDGGAWVNDVQEYVVVVGDHASDDHALAGGRTSDAADDDVVVVATFHLYLLDRHDAYYDAARVAMVVLDLDHDDSQVLASFRLGDQLHCFHY